jgi:hypothetical protein
VSTDNILDLVRAWADAELRGFVLTREQWLLAGVHLSPIAGPR